MVLVFIALQPPSELLVQGDKGKLEFHYGISRRGTSTSVPLKARIQTTPLSHSLTSTEKTSDRVITAPLPILV